VKEKSIPGIELINLVNRSVTTPNFKPFLPQAFISDPYLRIMTQKLSRVLFFVAFQIRIGMNNRGETQL
jgi:hypothetical protein